MYVIFSVGPYRLVYARKVTYVNSRQDHVRDTYFVVYCKATFSHAIFPFLSDPYLKLYILSSPIQRQLHI